MSLRAIMQYTNKNKKGIKQMGYKYGSQITNTQVSRTHSDAKAPYGARVNVMTTLPSKDETLACLLDNDKNNFVHSNESGSIPENIKSLIEIYGDVFTCDADGNTHEFASKVIHEKDTVTLGYKWRGKTCDVSFNVSGWDAGYEDEDQTALTFNIQEWLGKNLEKSGTHLTNQKITGAKTISTRYLRALEVTMDGNVDHLNEYYTTGVQNCETHTHLTSDSNKSLNVELAPRHLTVTTQVKIIGNNNSSESNDSLTCTVEKTKTTSERYGYTEDFTVTASTDSTGEYKFLGLFKTDSADSTTRWTESATHTTNASTAGVESGDIKFYAIYKHNAPMVVTYSGVFDDDVDSSN